VFVSFAKSKIISKKKGIIMGEETQKNLRRAFAGEAMARNKYTFFADQAIKDGLRSIARIFLETADNERAHAERLLEFMEDKPSTELVDYTVPVLGDSKTNLLEAIAGEHYENSKMYPLMREVALKENQKRIADVFKEIAEVEEEHEKRYRILLSNLKNGRMFKRPNSIRWKCLNCGYVHEGKTAPVTCPACGKPREYYEAWSKPY
jgi:rubrerythrin